MEDRSSRRLRTLVTLMAPCGLSANEIARALISMMARSATSSNRRPDTLMQDRTSPFSTNTSCDARPDHTLGQKRPFDASRRTSACRYEPEMIAGFVS